MQDYILTQPDDSKGNVNNGTVWRRVNTRVSNVDTTTNQTDLFGDFYVAGFKNSFSTGIELSREKGEKSSYAVNTDTVPGTAAANTNCTPSMIGSSSGFNCTSLSNRTRTIRGTAPSHATTPAPKPPASPVRSMRSIPWSCRRSGW